MAKNSEEHSLANRMQVGVIGINYKSSELSLREIIAKASQGCLASDYLEAARLSIVLLSTCNRTEVYFSADDLATAHSDILSLLRAEIEIPFEQKLYSFFGEECFLHLAKVTAGLDSAILGETEIQRQVKVAYATASSAYCLTSAMHFLFQKSLKIGKQMRSHFSLPKGAATLESIIFDLCHYSQDTPSSYFFIGNSEINRKILAYFRFKKAKKIALCTHHPSSAQNMSVFSGVAIADWNSLEEWQSHEIVISGSSNPHFLLFPGQIDQNHSLKTRLIFDLSMPRTVDPAFMHHPHIHLMNIEELSHLIADKRKLHLQDMGDAEKKLRAIVKWQLDCFHLKEKKRVLCA
jgi:glutamyl-tRNA reductase